MGQRIKSKTYEHQQKLIDFVDKYVKEKGYGPTEREMTSAIGYKSSSYGVVNWHISDLIARGFLSRVQGVARSLRVVNPPPYSPFWPNKKTENS